MKVKSLSRVRLIATPWTAAYQAPPSMGFSRQEYWSGVPLPSLEKWKSTKLQRGITSHQSEWPWSKKKKKKSTNKCWRQCGENCWWKYWYSHYGEQYGGSLKPKNKVTIWSSNHTPEHIFRENHNSKRHKNPNVHCSTIYNSQDMESNSKSIDS